VGFGRHWYYEFCFGTKLTQIASSGGDFFGAFNSLGINPKPKTVL